MFELVLKTEYITLRVSTDEYCFVRIILLSDERKMGGMPMLSRSRK